MIQLTAKFIGTDGSLGYKHGKTYNLHLLLNNGFWARVFNEPQFVIWRMDKSVSGFPVMPTCPYKNIATFMANWTNIKLYEKR